MNLRSLLSLALLLSTSTLDAVTQQPTFSSKVEVVRVDVLVTDKGQPVRGLQAADFEVLDNGVSQRVDFVSFEQLPINVILTLDMSDSVSGDRLEHLQNAGQTVLDGLKKEDQAALITFSNVVLLDAGLTSDHTLVRHALGHARATGGTSLVDASYAGLMLGESDVGRAMLIMFSDGLDTLSWLEADAVLETAKRCDVVVYGVSVGSLPKSAFLRRLSELSGGTLFEIESTTNLSTVFLGVLDEFRQRYLISYSPTGVAKDGWHQLSVRVMGRRATVKARPGYLAGS